MVSRLWDISAQQVSLVTAVPKRQRPSKAGAAAAAAVAVDPPGCSYNPEPEQHQDALAAAVAAEVSKAIEQELRPLAPQSHGDGSMEQDELTLLQVPTQAPGLASPIMHLTHAVHCLGFDQGATSCKCHMLYIICYPLPCTSRASLECARLRPGSIMFHTADRHLRWLAPRAQEHLAYRSRWMSSWKRTIRASSGSIQRRALWTGDNRSQRRRRSATRSCGGRQLPRSSGTACNRRMPGRRWASSSSSWPSLMQSSSTAKQRRCESRQVVSRFSDDGITQQCSQCMVDPIAVIQLTASSADRLGREAGFNTATAWQASVPTGASAGKSSLDCLS